MTQKIALIEDDKALVVMYQDALKRAGFEVATAYDGETGVEIIKTEKPDLILLDIMMPKLNGLEVMKKLKEDPEISATPVLVLTNYGTTDNVAATIELGAKAFVIKSDFTPEEIVEKVKNVLSAPAKNKDLEIK